jgi:hypothetical protein
LELNTTLPIGKYVPDGINVFPLSFYPPKQTENIMSTNDTVKYNDQHTTGMGYLNRARTVNPSQGQPYESVSLTGLGGRVDNPSYTFYDCTSVLGKAFEKYLLLKDDINDDNKKVMICFKVSDGRPDSYVTKDKQTGQDVRRHVIKCKLLDITWASIDGQVVQFELDSDDDDQQTSQSQQDSGDHINDNDQTNVQSLFSDDELDDYVKLDRDDPQFMAKKSELKSIGYRWDTNEKAWFRPAIA